MTEHSNRCSGSSLGANQQARKFRGQSFHPCGHGQGKLTVKSTLQTVQADVSHVDSQELQLLGNIVHSRRGGLQGPTSVIQLCGHTVL